MATTPTNSSTEKEQIYENLLANLPGMVYHCLNQKDYPMEFVSEGCLELTGYTPAELSDKGVTTYGKLIHEDDRQFVWDSIQEAVQQQTSFVLEYRIFRKDGQLRWVWEKGRATTRDETMILDGIILDITSRKKAEEAKEKANAELVASEKRFQLLTELAPSGIIISDNNRKTLYINQRFTDLFGYTIEDIPSIGEWWKLAYPDPEERDRVRKDWAALIAVTENNTSEIVQYESQVTCKNGSIRQIDFRAASNGEIYFVICSDITERCKLENQLHMAHKMESVGRLAGGVAHDFNNILGIIMGYAEMAIEKVKEDDLLHEDLTEILTAGKRSREITQQLLAFARKQIIQPEVVDINELINSALGMIRRLIGKKINLTWLPGTDLWPVKLDPAQLEQILSNLCINAHDAISKDGKIIIETYKANLDSYYCSKHQGFVPGEYVAIAVSDNGCGISKEALQHLYEPFFSTKDVGRSTGLGLATVYGIVKQNNGFINTYSELNVGTTIKIYLPRHIIPGTEKEAEKQDRLPKGNEEMLLLVEDDPVIMKMIKMLLERLNYQVETAGTPDAAIKLLQVKQGIIKLLITDVMLPEMDGQKLAAQLQMIQPDIKTLFMSGYTANQVAQTNKINKDMNFIQKPFSMQEIAIKLHEILSRKPD